MMTAILQLLVFVIAALAFTVYVLWKDRKEYDAKMGRDKIDDLQSSIYFPEHKSEENREHRGAAMSQL